MQISIITRLGFILQKIRAIKCKYLTIQCDTWSMIRSNERYNLICILNCNPTKLGKIGECHAYKQNDTIPVKGFET